MGNNGNYKKFPPCWLQRNATVLISISDALLDEKEALEFFFGDLIYYGRAMF